MPLPTPNSGETQDAFVERCMSNEVAVLDFPDEEQRLAVCFRQFMEVRGMSEHERKSLRVEIKDAEKGIVTAAFAKLDVKDRDNDLTLPGAFGNQNVRVSSYGHGSWMGELPVGRGTITEKDGEAVAELKFFMSTQHGREHFEVVKEMGELQEWSYGFEVAETGELTDELRQIGVRRVLKRLKVDEVSPVMRGAGIGTRTLSVKAESGSEDGAPARQTTALGALVKELRDAAQLSNGDLAEALAVPAATVAGIIDGTVRRPSLKRLENLAGVLKTSLSRLRSAAEADGQDYTDEDEMRSKGAAAEEARKAALKAEELAKSAETEARAAIAAKTALEAKAALERAEAFQAEAKSEFDRFARNMERYA